MKIGTIRAPPTRGVPLQGSLLYWPVPCLPHYVSLRGVKNVQVLVAKLHPGAALA